MSLQQESDPGLLWNLIKDKRFPVITTHQSGHGLHARPLALCNQDGDSLEFLWFLIPRRSDPVDDMQWDSAVALVFSAPDSRSYVAAFGSAVTLEDTGLKRKFWSLMQGWFPDAQSWFPSGVVDPSVALVRVKVIRADCWDIDKHTVTRVFSLHPEDDDQNPPPSPSGNGPLHA